MSDREMRELLRGVIADIESGRVRVPTLRSRVVRYLGPPLLAASLGMAGCSDTGVAPAQDASVQDATTDDAGPQPAYIAPFDAGPGPDAAYMAPFDASTSDSGIAPAYMVPFDAGPDPDYMAPFDGGIDEDGGAVPLYMGPPPQSP